MKSPRTPPASRRAQRTHTAKTSSVVPSEYMSDAEEEEFRSCLALIERHLGAVFEVGRALLIIRDKKLYRANYQTFEEFCREAFGMSRAYAWRHIQAAEVVSFLLPIGNKRLPTRESQVRPLIGLSPSAAQEVWSSAVESARTAKSPRVTAKHVGAARAKLRPAVSTKIPGAARLGWQTNLLKLIKQLKEAVERGDQAKAQGAIQKMELFVRVGTYNAAQEARNNPVRVTQVCDEPSLRM